ncbi:hypothetical protein H113_07615 [Trichophyton rubrum MR1459]|uniref:Uncharacterized protein n=1 Tax=Trichophyton soudanense CBS 452.61 TaxID=1215331 RepID=A0A022XI51_TRISD|nr:hypothetical protein H102_07538 [Trichophyton rubrum CBS 100081]EZF59528.1 hypothetical protein H104_07509 [Trichophyton rubrum CBS 289.86]EZF70038.1 hypothetical protein H105_07565 [Trichophyton soudanense CBS 452.61]EZF91542.1 hypothetical protein H113_07615 [Trichophyton rubrum MR1459]EZG02549.1 hypothetical protein H106_07391 [Trichophyton rubrum CBS 735.88]EZG21722.1 hypothetical protein H107_00280 [Trichophyton rubrum CBS 202.88]
MGWIPWQVEMAVCTHILFYLFYPLTTPFSLLFLLVLLFPLRVVVDTQRRVVHSDTIQRVRTNIQIPVQRLKTVRPGVKVPAGEMGSSKVKL